MADRAKEILDGCTHVTGEAEAEEGESGCVCRACADRAVEAAREEERGRALALADEVHAYVEGWRLERRDPDGVLNALASFCSGIKSGVTTLFRRSP